MKYVSQSFFRFCVMTAIAFGIHIGLPPLLHEVFHLSEELACAVALVVVFTGNYFLQRYYVYQAKEGDPRRQLLLYFLSSLGFRGAEYVTFLLVYNVLEVQYLVAYVGVLLVSFMIKFFYYGKFVFKGSRSDKP